MKEYRITITGMYDVIVVSPKMIGILIDKIRHSAIKELILPAEEILPQGYTEYLTCVLEANAEITKALPDRNVYTLIAEQIKKLQCNEQACFDRVEVTGLKGSPRFGMDTGQGFYVITKQENSRFRYIFKGEKDEEISMVLEYL